MNNYEGLEGSPLGRVERVNLLDVAHTGIERAYGYVVKALEGISGDSKGKAYMEHTIESLREVKRWLEEAMRELEG